jgi:hypothetical protein
MFIIFALVLAVVWVIGFAFFDVALVGFYMLPVIAVAALIAHFVGKWRQHHVT